MLIDKYMRDKLGLRAPVRAAVIYYAGQFWEQVLAVVPITMWVGPPSRLSRRVHGASSLTPGMCRCLVASMGIFFRVQVMEPGILAGKLPCPCGSSFCAIARRPLLAVQLRPI